MSDRTQTRSRASRLPAGREASEALLAERAEHNNRVSTRIAPLAAAAGLIMLIQHVVAPTPAAGYGSALWTIYLLVYAIGTVVATALWLIGRRARRWSVRASQAFSLFTASVFVVALTALSVVASSEVSNMGAVVLGVFVVAGAYRADRSFQVTLIIGALLLFALGRLVAWGEFDAVTVVLSVVVASFGLYVAASMEASRVEAFLARQELDRQNRVLAQLSATDPLTGVLNRRTAEHHLVVHLDAFRRYRALCSVVLVDVDHFKRINDSHGHGIGDEVLVEVARLLGSSLRSSDELARIGGEEFVLILPHTDAERAAAVAERLRAALASANLSSRALRVTASFGIAETSPGDESPRTLLDRADRALYAAKNAGRNRVECAHQSVAGGSGAGGEA